MSDNKRRKKIIENIIAGMTGNPLPNKIKNITDEELQSIEFTDEVSVIPISTLESTISAQNNARTLLVVEDALNFGTESRILQDRDEVSIVCSDIDFNVVKAADFLSLQKDILTPIFSNELKMKADCLLKKIESQQDDLECYAPRILEVRKLLVKGSFWARIFGSYTGADILNMSDEVFLEALKSFLDKKESVFQSTFLQDTKQRQITTVKSIDQYNNLDDLFKDEFKQKFENFIQLLRETDPPCIDENCNYDIMHKSKAVIVIWYKALEYKGVVERLSDSKEIAKLLNKKFIGLNISDSMIRAKNINAKIDHETDFRTSIAAIKAQKH